MGGRTSPLVTCQEMPPEPQPKNAHQPGPPATWLEGVSRLVLQCAVEDRMPASGTEGAAFGPSSKRTQNTRDEESPS